mmetsp:Transcript_35357/g.60052  ORF Transcript_35357/g.60052 Transcript_35357/m.60052 type:complete len:91 (-) Transcript_35357:351-623(-)
MNNASLFCNILVTVLHSNQQNRDGEVGASIPKISITFLVPPKRRKKFQRRKIKNLSKMMGIHHHNIGCTFYSLCIEDGVAIMNVVIETHH